MLLIKWAKTMFIIVFTMINIVATIIYIVFAKIGNVLRPMDRQIKVKSVFS